MTPTDRADRCARQLKVLSVGTRVRILQLLKDRVLCVNSLAARLGVTQGAVSQHLRILRDAGLVSDERRGYYVHYRLNEKTLGVWRETIGKLLGPASEAPARTTTGGVPCAATARSATARRRTSARSRRT